MQHSHNSPDLQTWIKFFRNALIQPPFAADYAQKFADNRIRFDMLGDLSRELLQEMGITALGDCLSILKHAKTISVALEDATKKEAPSNQTFDDTPQSTYVKKRCELAKQIIGNFSVKTEIKPSPTVESKTSSSAASTLSADLQSRLNFSSQPVVKFNDDSLSKVVVSSTTIDEDADYSGTKRAANLKRKLGRDDDQDDSDQPEYKSILKKRASTSSLTITTQVSPKANSSVKSRLSLNANPVRSVATAQSKVINLNTPASANGNSKSLASDSLYSSRIEEKKSIFERIKTASPASSSGAPSLASRISTTKPKRIVGEANKATIVKSLGATARRDVPSSATKSKVIPVTITLSGRSGGGAAATTKSSLKDRLSFN